jgi:hypothetical protein
MTAAYELRSNIEESRGVDMPSIIITGIPLVGYVSPNTIAASPVPTPWQEEQEGPETTRGQNAVEKQHAWCSNC